MVIGEEHSLHRLKAREPGIETEKTGEMKMQNLRTVPPHDWRQASDGIPTAAGRVRENFKRNIRQIQKTSHLLGWFAQKAQHALPATFAKLQRKLASKGFSPADPTRFNSKDGN